MGGDAVIVAGIGFRRGATLASLRAALEAAEARAGAGAGARAGLLATLADKAGADALCALARERGIAVRGVDAPDLAGVATPTRSARVAARFGTGSLAEAAALVAAGPGARLICTRVLSHDGTAVAAIAQNQVGDPT